MRGDAATSAAEALPNAPTARATSGATGPTGVPGAGSPSPWSAVRLLQESLRHPRQGARAYLHRSCKHIRPTLLEAHALAGGADDRTLMVAGRGVGRTPGGNAEGGGPRLLGRAALTPRRNRASGRLVGRRFDMMRERSRSVGRVGAPTYKSTHAHTHTHLCVFPRQTLGCDPRNPRFRNKAGGADARRARLTSRG